MHRIEPNWQMKRLRDMLDLRGIVWHDDSDTMFARTVTDEWRKCEDWKGRPCERPWLSAICGPWAMGKGEGLEVWIAGENEPRWLATAEEVLEAMGA